MIRSRASVPRALPYLILGVTFVYEVGLFAGFAYHFSSRSRDDRPLTASGEGMVVNSDGLGYYAWLRSALIDGDWDFDDEFDLHNALGHSVPVQRTPLGHRANPFSVGPACLWAPAVITTHWFHSRLSGPAGCYPSDGYSLPYQLAVAVTALVVSGVSLLLTFALARRFARADLAALAAAVASLGTPQFNYACIDLTMGHGSGTAAAALVVWYWHRGLGSRSWGRWAAVGGLVGLAALMRWQLALLAILPIGETIRGWWLGRTQIRSGEMMADIGRLALASLVALVAFLPQMIAWKVVYGVWLVAPVPLNRQWLRPDFGRVLLSTDRGFFYWTPLTLLAFLGCLTAIVRGGERCRPIAGMLVAFFAQVYFLASVTGEGVFLGSAFGYRQLTESVVLLVPGLAWAFDAAQGRVRRILIAICVAGCAANVLLVVQYRTGILPPAAGADLATILAGFLRLPEAYPVYCAVFLSGPAAISALLIWCRHWSRPRNLAEHTLDPRAALTPVRLATA